VSSAPLPPDALHAAIQNETAYELEERARLIVDRPPTRKSTLVALVHSYLADAGNLRDVLSRLDPLQKAAVAEAAHAEDGRFPRATFAAKYGRQPEWRSGSRLPLFFYRDSIPSDLRVRLRALLPTPQPFVLASSPEPPATAARGGRQGAPLTVRATESAAVADLFAVLGLGDLGRIRYSAQTGLPSAASQRAVAEVLRDGDFYDGVPIAGFAWPLLVQAGGLVQAPGGGSRLTASGRAAVGGPPYPTLRHLWQRWLGTETGDEFLRVDGIKGQRALGGLNLTPLQPRRQAIANALAGCPVGGWVRLDDFLRYMRVERYTFSVVRDPTRLYLGRAVHKTRLEGYDDDDVWLAVQGRYVLCLLFEYAATLGLIDVAYGAPEGARDDYHDMWGSGEVDALSRYDGLGAFRITGLGAYCLGHPDAGAPGGRGRPGKAGAV